MSALETAAALGIRVAFEDLGDWGAATLVAEYDPHGPAIRVSPRALDRLCGDDPSARARTIEEAVRHELYHHREAIGAVERYRSRAARERAARAYARSFDD